MAERSKSNISNSVASVSLIYCVSPFQINHLHGPFRANGPFSQRF